MCGICGIISDIPKPLYKEQIKRMLNSIRHRGPDEFGFYLENQVLLAHARLSIIDLEASKQPMSDPTGRFTIIFNGEIYNYLEIKEKLISKGIKFSTTGDTEVLLNAFIEWGINCVLRLNGMFAFAIWDSYEKRLFLARDRMGQKPLFYALINNNFYFASELCAFKELNINFSIDEKSICEYLEYGFIKSPNTVFKEIRELRPANYLEYTGKEISIKRFWSPPTDIEKYKDEQELKEELCDLLTNAVDIRLRSDVPLGAFLSGGLDSSIIVSLIKKIIPHGNLHTFCIGFDQDSFDETGFARDVACYFSTIHHEKKLSFNLKELESLLPKLVKHYGQPFGDSSAIPTWFLCSHTVKRVKVSLSGDGGDELFGGYQRYIAQKILLWYKKLPRAIRKNLLNKIIELIPESTSYYQKSFIKKLKLFARLDQKTMEDITNYYSACFSKEEIIKLIPEIDNSLFSYKDSYKLGEIEYLAKRLDPISFMMFNDIYSYLPDDILTKVDRVSMAQGLEVRAPFMDYRIVEFACRLPVKYKIRGFTTKYILRQAFSPCLPNDPLKRPKHGFSVPVGDWFKAEFKTLFLDMLEDCPDFINKVEAKRLLDIHLRGGIDIGHRLWLLLFLGLWYRWWFNK